MFTNNEIEKSIESNELYFTKLQTNTKTMGIELGVQSKNNNPHPIPWCFVYKQWFNQ
jgi:hypothetical protein